MKHFIREIQVRFSETDEMGIVHHSNYFTWFEISRFELLQEAGIDYNSVKNSGFQFLVTRCECEYKNPAKFGNTLIVRLVMKLSKSGIMNFDYTLLRKVDYELLAVGRTEHVIAKNGKLLIGLPDFMKEKIYAISKKYEWE